MHDPHAAGLTQRSASPPSCCSSGLTWQHPAGANAPWRGMYRPSAPRTIPGISGGAAPSREASPAPGPQLSTGKQWLRTKQTSCKYLKYVEARGGGATADHERGGDETRAGNNKSEQKAKLAARSRIWLGWKLLLQTLVIHQGAEEGQNRDASPGHWSGLVSQTCLMQSLAGMPLCQIRPQPWPQTASGCPDQPHGIQCDQRMIPTIDIEKSEVIWWCKRAKLLKLRQGINESVSKTTDRQKNDSWKFLKRML